jgi:type IV pilus assembly protein PilY1
MTRIVLAEILLAILLALLRGDLILAQECEENAASPKSASALYRADGGGERVVTFQPGADGVLRAIDAASGGELWAFAPAELDSTHRADGLMSDVRVLRFDADLNGSIEPAAGDRVWLYFGMRRSGRYYYALDVTDSGNPQLLWKLGPGELPGLGETWSTPTIARVRIAGAAQNGEHFVLIVGGGYHETLSSARRIFMVDAATGQLLWYAGAPGTDAPDLVLPQMLDPIPARIAVLDTDGDRYADRFYAADLGGRIWRFDIWNGQGRSQLVTGGVLAALADAAPENARRFFNAPDVALIQHRGGTPYYNLAIGSGNRAEPFDVQVHDRFYSIRDFNPFVKLAQSSHDMRISSIDDDFLDITDSLGSAAVPATAAGWKLELRLNGSWSGEKVLTEALTVNGVILFVAYKPLSAASCTGENRVYAVNVEQGNPALDFNDDLQVDRDDASMELTQWGIAGEVELALPQPDASAPPRPGGAVAPDVVCKVGTEALRLCATIGSPMRTFWQRNSAD